MGFKASYLLFMLVATFSLSHAYSHLILANVTINCPYDLQLSTLPIYPQTGTINMNYTVQATSTCTIPALSGYFTLVRNGSTVLNYSQSITDLNQTKQTLNLTITANSIPSGNYTAAIYLEHNGYQNHNTSEFQLLPPAHLVINSFYTGSVNISAPISFYLFIKNDGYYAANSISLNMSISGPSITGPNPYYVTQSLNPLSPSQSENTVIIVNNVTSVPGTYYVTANITYVSNNASGNSVSNSLSYTVRKITTHPSVGPVPTTSGGTLTNATVLQTTSPIPGIYVMSAPLYITTISGQQVSSILGLMGQSNVTVYLNVPSEFSHMLTVSSHTIALSKNNTQYVQLVFDSSGVAPGTYLIPLNITGVSGSGKVVKRTEYFSLVSYPKNNQSNYPQVAISQQVQIFNSSSAAQATITVRSLKNTTIYNATLYTKIPLSTGNLSQIHTYGLPNNISATNLGYTIKWFIPVLPPEQTVYAYYSINKPQNPLMLSNIQNVFSEPSIPANSSILKIVRLDAPSIPQNSNGTVTVFALYTGTSATQVRFSLSGGQNMDIINPIVYVNATPNELITQTFNVRTHNATGTNIAKLSVSTTGATYDESIPLIILPDSNMYVSQQISQYPLLAFFIANRSYVIIIAAALLVLTSLLILYRIMTNKFIRAVRPEDRRNIVRLRERIRRSEIGEEV